MIKRVSILGCGWLGLPLAQSLLEQGFEVKGSTTSNEKLAQLSDIGIDAFQVTCSPRIEFIAGDVAPFFDTDVLVITLPFRRSFDDSQYYFQQISSVVDQAVQFNVPHVLFTSSTSIYPAHNQTVLEDAPLQPEGDRPKTLMQVEQLLLQHNGFEATVVRCAGLYGGARRIGQFLAGKQNLANGQAPVNLIHLDDSVGILKSIIEQGVWGEVFNACSDAHPTRKELYECAAEKMGLPKPTFVHDEPQYKIVSNDKVKARLFYTMTHPDPMKDVGA